MIARSRSGRRVHGLVPVAAAVACAASCVTFTHTRAELGPGCAAGDADDCLSLGTMLRKGQGGGSDLRAALDKLERACALGNSIGCDEAADMYELGEAGHAAKAEAYRRRARELDARALGQHR
jgi:TPR repeat protein